MYYIKNMTNGWRSEERYETIFDAIIAASDIVDQISATVLHERYSPKFVIMEEPINEQVTIVKTGKEILA